ncbi:eukaryotic translation initiation factor [Salix suchowensis]|nr:eukaryotic translation initiation factor [Salix suchowensis]
MAPKTKGKKGKKTDDDFWEKADDDVEDAPPVKPKVSAFAALGVEDTGAEPEEEEDFGGLMVCTNHVLVTYNVVDLFREVVALKASANKKKDKKDKKKKKADSTTMCMRITSRRRTVQPKGPIEVTADDLADESGVRLKTRRGRREEGKEDVSAAPDDEELGIKVLSKKEKEKLKKEREKVIHVAYLPSLTDLYSHGQAKKKAQATAKKTAEGGDAPPAPEPPAPKKKKKAKKEEDAPAAAAAAGKKKGGISALKALMEEKKRLEEEAKRREEEERLRIEEEERQAAEEERKKEEEKQRRKEKEKAKREVARKEGRLLTKKQKEERAMAELRKKALLQSGVQIEGLQQATGNGLLQRKWSMAIARRRTSSKRNYQGGVSCSSQKVAAQRKAEAAERRAKAHEAALAARSKDNLRSPICCILGHVDTGKTKLLDKIRQTNVQEGEAGGITQQIGAPIRFFCFNFSSFKLKDGTQEYKIPGLLVIDTPGHESFTNLRSRGSSLCNIAILVVDIMIDRMYGWKAIPDNSFVDSLAQQARSVQREFEDRLQKTILAFAEEGLNAVLYYENKNFARNVSLVPTSAITGEGVPDMIMLLVNLTQQRMSDRLMYLSELECTVLEVKVVEGLGTTIDVVLSNGILHEGDKIVVCGLNGPIVTQIRALLTPQPLRELRIKSAYVHHKEVRAALGVKITAPDLEKAIAGSRLLVYEIMSDLSTLLNNIDKSGKGVCVQASTLGSLEALLDFLNVSKIPVSGINIGPVHKKDIMRAGTMLEKAKELAVILAFDVPKWASRSSKVADVIPDIIYHLFDAFTRTMLKYRVWPCRLKIIAAFCKRDPIILGVDILDGSLRVGTPIAVVKVDPVTQKKEIHELGKITSLEINHKTQDVGRFLIEHAVYQSAKMFGRHFDDKDELYSRITVKVLTFSKLVTLLRAHGWRLTLFSLGIFQG